MTYIKSFIILTVCFFVVLGFDQKLIAAEHPITSSRKIIFEGESSRRNKEAEKIIAEAAQYFEEITSQSLNKTSRDKIPIRIRFESSPLKSENRIHEGIDDRIQGITYHSRKESRIVISKRYAANWERILAHETVHVFVRAVYGRAINQILNEGLAEYIAEKVFPTKTHLNPKTAIFDERFRPYSEGFRFCEQYATDPYFSDFFALEIKKPGHSLRNLIKLWDLRKIKHAQFEKKNYPVERVRNELH